MSDEIDFIAPEPEELNAQLPAYEVSSLVAKGGMGAVYLATQISLDREVAIKVLPAEFGDDSFRAQFATEAKAMARLNHQNLIGIFDFGEVNGMPYIVMEYVNGKSLYYSAYHRQIEQKEAVRLIIDICHGLGHAHEAGILHRDIKPANILLNDKAEPKIGDFGLARAATEKGADDEIIYGTPGYAAPEVVNNPSEVDRQSDIYAVGVMLHELLTSELPDKKGTPPSQICGCDPRIDAIVRKAIQKDASLRYPTAEALAADLEKIRPTLRKSILAVSPDHAPAKTNTDGATPSPKPSPTPGLGSRKSPKVGSNAPFLRNLVIIALLIGALVFALNLYKEKNIRTASEQARLDQEKKEAREKRRLEANKPKPQANNDNNNTPIPDKPEPGGDESTEKSLARLKNQLSTGDRSEFPKAALAYSKSHFLLIDKKLNWSQAAEFCEQHGGHLATIQTADDLDWLTQKLPSDTLAWLGGAAVGSTWKWVDGSKWALREPSTSLGSHVAIADTGIIRPRTAKTDLSFIIEWSDDGSNNGGLKEQLQRTRNTAKNTVPDWPPGTIGFGERRYLLVQRELKWEEAAALASLCTGKLAVPAEKEESCYLKEYLDSALPKGESCWLGGQKIGTDWTWTTGEAWSYANWAAGFPIESGFLSALRYTTGDSPGWTNFDPSLGTPAFIIEWSKDGRDAIAEPEDGSDLKDLQTLAKNLVSKAVTKYFAAIKKAADDAILEADTWLRGLPKSQQDMYGEGLSLVKDKLKKNPLIDDSVPLNGMPEKLEKIVAHYAGKQTDAKDELTADLDKLRKAYIGKLEETKATLKATGLKDKIARIDQEIAAIGRTAESFSDYFSR